MTNGALTVRQIRNERGANDALIVRCRCHQNGREEKVSMIVLTLTVPLQPWSPQVSVVLRPPRAEDLCCGGVKVSGLMGLGFREPDDPFNMFVQAVIHA